ncbi:MAG TPA: AAA-like domain-containing protein [Oscillatoriaceae cyanobacterium M33_DOE_052]|uniref:Serine/threonine protein kinase n=1 Tax=Planktothricoides sp. SpSt-374 TaxID=2282167 RepID=A0A7C3VQR4_9CYAN|nr:AAA-like domain-containing protein [Oscillatoriaceae cyanobacterium M33_DOE_052]
MEDPNLSFEDAIEVADAAVFASKGRHLTDVEMIILRGSWQNQTYPEMAENSDYAANYLQRTAGPKLWVLLSEVLGEEVKKTNFRTALERLQGSRQYRRLPAQQSFFGAEGAIRESPLQQTWSPIATELEFPEGPVALDSPFYIERPPIESDCCLAILQPGGLVSIKAPRHMGKTSLLNRILDRVTAPGIRTVNLNLLLAERGILKNLDLFLRWFCQRITRELQLENKLDEYWDEDIFSSNTNCTDYFEEYLLTEIEGQLILGIDEVDRVFAHPQIASDFLSLLRFWHESAKENGIWKKLSLVIAHSTEVYIDLDVNKSPFNVGLPVKLPEFTPAQVEDLARRYELEMSPELTTQRLSALQGMVGGHPYLIRLAFYHLRRQDVDWEELLAKASTDLGIYRQHLEGYWATIQEHPELKIALKQAVLGTKPVPLELRTTFKLVGMGLVKRLANGVEPSCELYRRYFLDKLRHDF